MAYLSQRKAANQNRLRATLGPSAYRGYLINRCSLFGGDHHVSKGGFHIATYASVEAARAGIDQLQEVK